jgi:hypothetical protein
MINNLRLTQISGSLFRIVWELCYPIGNAFGEESLDALDFNFSYLFGKGRTSKILTIHLSEE